MVVVLPIGCASTTTVRSRFSRLFTISNFCEDSVGWGKDLEIFVCGLDVLTMIVEQSLVNLISGILAEAVIRKGRCI